MGLAGVELHGLLGYTVLAKYKLEFDFTRDKLKWEMLNNFDPPPPQALNIKGGAGGLDMMAGLMKFVSFMAGLKPAPPPVQRGFLGIEMMNKEDGVYISAILPQSPAEKGGLRVGDRLATVNGDTADSDEEVRRHLAQRVARPGRERDRRPRGDFLGYKVTAGNGL